uniref:Uncharacterized protein n=1 Tax=Aegilops tauschii subsp. strangulata TaxID=200361 RepID=A0A453IYQ3_AEGTS
EPDLGVSRDWGPSRSMCFPMSGGGMVTCSSADAIVAGARDALGREGKDVARYDAGSCQAPLVPDNWMQASHGVPLELDGATTDVSPNALYSSSSMNVEISPPVLDWGRSNLYAASVASLTVVNLNNDSALRVYEPFSTDPQFYVYGYEDLVLQPGENASVTFMFLPKLLGSSSAHLVLQTNFGGFIIQAKGMAVGSPYQILPLTRMDVVIGGHLEKNLSIYNPFDDSLYVEEVAVWMSASESTKQSSHSEETSANSRTGSLGSIIETEGPHNMKPTIRGAIRADDMVLRNWRSHGTITGISVLTNHELLFPVVQIGSQFSEWITVHNPSQQHVTMQLVLNSEEIIGQCRTVNDECEHTFSSRSPEIDSTETRFGFSLGSKAITETYLGPLRSAVLGPIVFRPSNRCMWSSMALIRNNLSGLEWLPLRAPGGWQSIALLEGPEAVWKLEFNLGSNLDDNSTLSKSEIPSPSCSQQLSKEIHVKNSGDLPLRVTKVKVSGVDCGLDGFTVNNCKGFSLAPSESIRMLISFKADFSSVKVQRDLELAMTTGIFVIPMTANIPVCMLKQCKRSYFRSIHWKALILFFGTVLLFVVVIVRGAPYSLSANSQDYYVKIADRKDAISKTVKPSFPQGSNKTSRPIREHRKAEEAPPEKCPPSTLDSPRKKDAKSNPDKQQNATSAISVSPANPVEDKVSTEVTETSGNLTIRVAREKGRRRKRKVGGAGLAAKFEVSSSHSGNSTPSSPLSPSLTPKQGWSFSGASSEPKHRNKLESRLDVEARAPLTGNNKVKNGWSQTSKEQPPAPRATSVNPLASSTALTTAWRSPLLAASSPIAPHARAPGSNLMKDKAVKRDEGVTALKKEFTYDIWGDHFSGHLLGKAREVAPGKVFTASEGSSYSFFAREPQALVMKQPSAPPDSRGRRSLPSDVASGYAIN